MIITSFSYKKTVQVKQYEPVVIEAAGVPGEGQTAAEAFAELAEFVDAKMDEEIANVKGAPTKPKSAAKPASSAPPLANKGAKPEKADPTPATSTSPIVKVGGGAIEPPFEPGSKVAAKPKPKKKRGRPAKKVPDHEKELNFTLEAESLEELFERFCNLRTFADAFGSVENWAGACRQVQARYKELNSPLADKEVVGNITAALTSESAAIAERRNAELAEVAS